MNDAPIQEKDYGMLWSVLCIVITISIGCGVICYIDGDSFVEVQIEDTLRKVEQKLSASAPQTVADESESLARVEGALPPGYIQFTQ